LPRDTFEELRQKMIQSAKEGIKEAYSSEEYALINAINAYLDINKSYNLVYERLTEWYGIYFPEVEINNSSTLTELALLVTKNPDADFATYLEIVKDNSKAKYVYERSKESIGRKMNDDEKAALRNFAELSKSMAESLAALEAYMKIASGRLMPNTTYLTDEKIAAELLSKAGSLERLATMPASTVQLLGAEKALFKHLKFGSKPPKYGVLFKMPEVNAAQRDQRGRIARVYATKICIGLKADYYTKNFIGESLKKSLEESVAKIKASPPRPKRPQQDQRDQRRPQGGGGFRGKPRQGGGGGRPQGDFKHRRPDNNRKGR
jgi:nucleolar protein 56